MSVLEIDRKPETLVFGDNLIIQTFIKQTGKKAFVCLHFLTLTNVLLYESNANWFILQSGQWRLPRDITQKKPNTLRIWWLDIDSRYLWRQGETFIITYCTRNAQRSVKQQGAQRSTCWLVVVFIGWFCNLVKAL